VFTTAAQKLPSFADTFAEMGLSLAQFAWFVEGRPHDVELVANRRARIVIVQTPPSGPNFTLPLESYDGGIEAQIHCAETYTSTGFKRCERCVRERAVNAEEVKFVTISNREELLGNPLYLEVVEQSVRAALAGRRGYEEFDRQFGHKRLKRALNNRHVLIEIGTCDALFGQLLEAAQQRLEELHPH
jgi:hypothetical protein